MSFLSPAFLLGLPLIAIPVLIHLFARKQRDVIRWGAMEFLLASATPRRRFLRLRDLLLLLLRTALVLAIVAALAQPMISSNWIGTTGPRDVILVLDNSMSTARKLGTETVFERELAEADRLLWQLNATDTARILLAAPIPEWFGNAPVTGNSGGLHALRERLSQLKPNDGVADMLECVQEAIKVDSANKNMPRFITVVTDGQAHGWRADATGAWSAMHALAQKAFPPVYTRAVVVDGTSGPVANLAVEKMSAARAVTGAGQPVVFTAAIKNTGTVPSAATSLAWKVGEESLGSSAIPELQPGVGTAVSLSQSFTTGGLIDVSCHLAGQDELPPDNSAHYMLAVAKSIPVLIVEGEPQTDPIQSDTRYFLAALGYGEAGGELATPSVFKPKLIDYQRLDAEQLSAFQCVVLANVPRLPADAIKKLARYVNSGGGLWMALGEQTDIAAFNQAFFESSASLSPLALGQPTGDADDREKFNALTPPAAEHPATALLADTQRLDIDRVRVYRHHQFDSAAGASVLLRVEGGAPVAVEKNLGRGRVVVQVFPLGLAWSNFPLCHSYVVMVHEWLWYLTQPGLVQHNLQAGELLQASQPVDSSNGRALLETPTGRNAQLIGIEEAGRLVFRHSKTLFPGEYRLTVSGAAPGSPVEKFYVNRDPEESNLTPLSPAQRQTLSDAGGIGFGTDPLFQPPTRQIQAPPKALANWLLVAVLLLIALEIALAFWLGYRRRAVAPALSIEPRIRA